MSEVLRLGDKIYPDFVAAGSYYGYIQNKIYNESRLASVLNNSGIITESGLGRVQVFSEAKLADSIKAKWNKFIEFIKGLFAKFAESLSNILLNEKDYLEKYKDIILKKKPRDDLEFSYTGDYAEGIKRMMNTELPVFNYEAHAAALKQEGNAPIIKIIMSGKDFTYDEGDTPLADQMKSYYLALEKGQKQGKFSELNFKDMYNFCYNFNKIKEIVNKDVKHLDSSSAAIQQAILKELRMNGENTSTATANQPEENSTGSAEGAAKPTNDEASTEKAEESAIIREADEKVKIGSNLSINTSAISQTGSYTGDANKNPDDATKANNANAATKAGETEESINKMVTKWINVCNPIITAKMYAAEHIAKDYMEMIRTHVRSYGGKDLKKKETNRAEGTQTATNYQKNSTKGQAEQPTTT